MKRGSSAWSEKFWGPAPVGKKFLGKVSFYGGGAAWVHAATVGVWLKINLIFEKYNYEIKKPITGGYNPRQIAGTDRWSNHAYGTAIDFNWSTNPRLAKGEPMVCDMPAAMIDEIKNLKTNDGLPLVRWGGDYRWPDPMHFEIMVTPAELGNLGQAKKPKKFDDSIFKKEQILSKGDKGLNVKFLQQLLLAWDSACLPKFGADSDFGGETEDAVKEFQKNKGLEPTGSIDFMTSIALSVFAKEII